MSGQCERVLSPFYRGDTVKYVFKFTNDDGTPQDVTNWVITVTLKSDIEMADVDAELQVSTILGPPNSPNGEGLIELTSADTSVLTPGKYHIDIQRKIPGTPDDIQTIHYQLINVLADVTRT